MVKHNQKEKGNKKKFSVVESAKKANSKMKDYSERGLNKDSFIDLTVPQKLAHVMKHIFMITLYIFAFAIFTGYMLNTTLDLVDSAINNQHSMAVKDPILYVTLVTSFATSINTAVLILGLPKLYKITNKYMTKGINRIFERNESNKKKQQAKKQTERNKEVNKVVK